MSTPRVPAELCRGPFTVRQALAVGLTRRQLQSRPWRALVQGVYVHESLDDSLDLRARAIALVLPPDAVVGYHTAAWLHGADVLPRSDTRQVDVVAQRGDQIRRAGVRARSALLEPGDVTEIGGVPVTTPTRTAFDLARQPSLVEAVVGLDALLNRGGCRLDDVAAYIAGHRRWRGVRFAEAAFVHAEPLSQSPMESRQRMRLVLAGLPRPVAQVPVTGPDGRIFAYIDNGYPSWLVGADYDGGIHGERWRYDLERQERIRDAGWWHRRYSVLHIQSGWKQMVEQVGAALRRAGWRPGLREQSQVNAWERLRALKGA